MLERVWVAFVVRLSMLGSFDGPTRKTEWEPSPSTAVTNKWSPSCAQLRLLAPHWRRGPPTACGAPPPNRTASNVVPVAKNIAASVAPSTNASDGTAKLEATRPVFSSWTRYRSVAPSDGEPAQATIQRFPTMETSCGFGN
jgi:hypothetical protein